MRLPASRLSSLPRWLAALALGGTLLFAVLLLLTAIAPSGPTSAPSSGPSGNGDLAAYLAIIERMRGGESYYPAAHAVLLAEGYGTASVFNWRTPLWPMLLAALPGLVWAQALLGAIAVAAMALIYRMLRHDAGLPAAIVGTSAVALSLAGLMVPESVAFTEIAAGTLILLSVAAYGNRLPWVGLAAALAALFLRELAAPYVLICLGLAWRQNRRPELLALLFGLAAYAAFFAWHALQVTAQLGPLDRAYDSGWLQFGGLGFLLGAAGFNGLLGLAPAWVTALLLPLGLLGLWLAPNGSRAALTLTAYLIAFTIVGKPFNTYWGALFTPLMMLGLAWLVPSLPRARSSPI